MCFCMLEGERGRPSGSLRVPPGPSGSIGVQDAAGGCRRRRSAAAFPPCVDGSCVMALGRACPQVVSCFQAQERRSSPSQCVLITADSGCSAVMHTLVEDLGWKHPPHFILQLYTTDIPRNICPTSFLLYLKERLLSRILAVFCCSYHAAGFKPPIIPLLILLSSSISQYTLFPPFISIDIFPFCLVGFALKTPDVVKVGSSDDPHVKGASRCQVKPSETLNIYIYF